MTTTVVFHRLCKPSLDKWRQKQKQQHGTQAMTRMKLHQRIWLEMNGADGRPAGAYFRKELKPGRWIWKVDGDTTIAYIRKSQGIFVRTMRIIIVAII